MELLKYILNRRMCQKSKNMQNRDDWKKIILFFFLTHNIIGHCGGECKVGV